MIVKKFEAETLEQGLKNIRHELGPDALILGTQRKRNGILGKGMIEITAAYEKKEEKKSAPVDSQLLMQVFPHRKGPQDSKRMPARYIEIEDSAEKNTSVAPRKSRYETDFLRAGLSAHSAKELAIKLVCDHPEDLNDPEMLEKQKVRLLGSALKCMKMSDLVSKKAIAFWGTAGSGKTTSLVKFALFLKQQSRGVSLTSLDSRKVVSGLEMAQYSRMLRVPFRKVEDSKSSGIQLIDTPSLRLDSEDANWGIVKKLESLQASTILCLEATLRLPEMLRAIDIAQSFTPVEAIWITKMDLATQSGFLYDLIKQTKIPICAVSQSQSFQEKISFPEPVSLGRTIIKRGEMV